MGKLDDVFAKASEGVKEQETIHALAERLSSIMKVEEAHDGYKLSRRDDAAYFDGGHFEDDKGRNVQVEFSLGGGTPAVELPYNPSKKDPNELESTLSESAKRGSGIYLRLLVDVDLATAHRRVNASETLGRLIGFDEQGRPVIVNPDWDKSHAVVTQGEAPAMYLDPESDEYKDALMWLYGIADNEADKQRREK